MFSSVFTEKFRSNPLCDFRLGTVATSDHETPLTLWPCTPGLLVKWVSFLSTLHWLVGDLDLGVGGISYVELIILYELWAGERLF